MINENLNTIDIWKAALGQIQLCVNKSSFETWFKDTRGTAYTDNCFTVIVDNSFIQENLQKTQTTFCENVLSELLGHPTKVKFVLAVENAASSFPAVSSRSVRKECEFTFERFIVGEQNRLAVATALSVARHPGQSYNPLVIYGKVGLGKTHLLRAIGYLAEEEGFKAVFVSSEQFTNEFVSALRDKKTDHFNQKYRSADLLLIDDIQFIRGKTQTEECFFHIFNELRSGGKQLVISSNCHPRDIPEVDARLRSRFEWGMSIEVCLPDEKNRRGIVRALLLDQHLKAEEGFIEFLSRQKIESVRELIGSFNKAIAYCRLKRLAINTENAQRALGVKINQSRATLNIERVLQAVSAVFEVNREDILGDKRDKNTAMARRTVVYFLKTLLNLSLVDIGAALGGKSISAISQNYCKITEDLQNNIFTKRKINEVQEKLS